MGRSTPSLSLHSTNSKSPRSCYVHGLVEVGHASPRPPLCRLCRFRVRRRGISSRSISGRSCSWELDHSSEDIEEAWLTSRPSRTRLNGHGPADGPFSISLDEWCPGLHTFICSADAEWNWQSPDWITPHVLLPTLAGLKVFSVRDMERRLKGDANDAARRRRANVGLKREDDEDEDPYFMLFEQFSSLLRKEAFPSLTHIRDMSRESDVIRRSGCIFLNSTSPSPSPAPLSQSLQPPSPLLSTTIVEPSSRTSVLNLLTKPRKLAQAAQMAKRDKELAQEQGRRVIRFWTGIVEKCMERGVGLMNWRGEEVC